METIQKETDYPSADLFIECPSQSDRLSAFFRIFYALPILILFSLVIGFSSDEGMMIGGGILFLPVMLTILFRNRYPKVWFEWNLYLSGFMMRVVSYLFLLRDEYPSIDDQQFVKLDLRYPDVEKELSRGLPLIKWFLAIPHYLVLAFLFIAVITITIIAWFSILFTGKYPPRMHEFVVGVFRWGLRVNAYAFLLLTDKYPPFRL
ncbi:MAG: DUF4389 domain-containing protein [Chitinivibrionales bacterium]|nr:DUF4389 domain-containing protein [Chitinivibrionales bacterium]